MFEFISRILKKVFKKKKVEIDFEDFPIIQRVYFPSIINDIVSVQPMSAPSGITFYLDYNYDNPNAATRKVLIEKYIDPYKKYKDKYAEGINHNYYSTIRITRDGIVNI